MQNPLILLAIILIASFVGYIIGQKISKLKSEKENIASDEKMNQLGHQLDQQKISSETEKNNLIETISKSEKTIESLQADASKNIEQLRTSKDNELEELRQKNNSLSIEHTKLEAELKNTKEKLTENKEEVEKLQEKFTKEFENLANKILDEKSIKFKEQNKESIGEILNPLKEKIQIFEKKVEDTNKESIVRNSALKQQIEGLEKLNLKMSQEAINLTKALKGDSKTQGNWGELILERVLEKSGLEKGREYDLEKSFATEEEGKTRLRPDVIINLPDNRKMVVDSKVSLTAYEQYVNSETEEEKVVFVKEHVNSLKRHVDQLSAKKYEDLHQIESPDFVLLFIPIEPAFAVALEADHELYNKAFVKNIVIVTPSTLLATLRTIDSMWQNEKQQKNAIEIARQAGALYDKFEGLLQDLIKVGNKLKDTKTEYEGAMNKLVNGRGNLITSVEKIKKLGAKAKKALPNTLLERAQDSDS
ncbi:DNA recombination protein RmuC [Flavicella sp.]|uniref:DNA recombination protein RmuC n=1 Tax=Flavicella sp. TaxID=2957742 RepID=UPI002631D4D3|nr:DNA recombination protein RmuC [Flavicella sp.]MDG1805158.1 DNA recombination protein RmuC [Flavicella sp.]